MNVPDVIGFSLKDACECIREAGLEIGEVLPTAPPRHKHNAVDENCRVIRQRTSDDGRIELLVCNPDIDSTCPS